MRLFRPSFCALHQLFDGDVQVVRRCRAACRSNFISNRHTGGAAHGDCRERRGATVACLRRVQDCPCPYVIRPLDLRLPSVRAVNQARGLDICADPIHAAGDWSDDRDKGSRRSLVGDSYRSDDLRIDERGCTLGKSPGDRPYAQEEKSECNSAHVLPPIFRLILSDRLTSFGEIMRWAQDLGPESSGHWHGFGCYCNRRCLSKIDQRMQTTFQVPVWRRSTRIHLANRDIFNDRSPFHHELDTLENCYISEWVAFYRNQVSIFPHFDGADVILPTHQFGRI